ncbi:MAG: FG-GAP repeat domain-containing protein [Kofleriaceae bacterium]
MKRVAPHVVYALAVLVGCDQVFNLTRPPARDDAMTNNDAVDASPGTCDLGPAGPAVPIQAKGVALVAGTFDSGDTIDLAIARNGFSTVLLQRNVNGDFTPAVVDVGSPIVGLAPGAINNDTLDDIAVLTESTAGALLQTASSWDSRVVATIATPRSISIASFDGVGLADLLVTFPASEFMQIFFGDASMYTTVGGSIPTTGQTIVAAIAVDVDDDGDQDIVAAVENQNGIGIYFDDGPSFMNNGVIATGSKPSMLAAGRLGDRAVVDLVVLNADSGDLTVVRNGGAGNFATMDNIAIGEGPMGLTLVDMNADLFPDILAVSNKESRLSVLRGTATGFELPRDYTTVAKPVALAVGDVTGDGRFDVAVLGEDDGFVIHPTVCSSMP